MERHLSLGVATIVALLQAHRTGFDEVPQHDENDRIGEAASGPANPDNESPPELCIRH